MYMKNNGPKIVKSLLEKAEKEDFLNQIFRHLYKTLLEMLSYTGTASERAMNMTDICDIDAQTVGNLMLDKCDIAPDE